MFTDKAMDFIPLISVTAGVIVLLWIVNWIIAGRSKIMTGRRRRWHQVIMSALTIIGILAILFVIPFKEAETRGQLLRLLGIALTAVIALSSTSFLSNIMAGFMIRSLHNFKPGDFVHVGNEFGRVTAQGLFHTEIQTEDRDLVTLPNLYLSANPTRVVRASGTIVSATVSLGYDVDHLQARKSLLEAAENTHLDEPFVQVLSLGDFSVTYRVAGFLQDVSRLLTTRSLLRESMLDALHAADIEIVSPTFMNQRRIDAAKTIPEANLNDDSETSGENGPPAKAPESMMFDKADQAASIEQLRREIDESVNEIQSLKAHAKSAEDDGERSKIEREITLLESRIESYEQRLRRAEERQKDTE